MQKKKSKNDYYLGLDIGTSSVGYAVTDENYKILKFNGKSMWGSRLFDEAETAEGRRGFRTTRRRLQRRRWRINILQELFSEEINKVDSGFYRRMQESALLSEDKSVYQENTLFCDKGYCDEDYYKEYPTIYHLRQSLLTEDKKHDIRLIYLAIHHILKHRGHFLFSGSVENATSFQCAYQEMVHCLKDEFDIVLSCASEEELSKVIKDRHFSKRDKANKVLELLHYDNGEKKKQIKAMIGLICGSKVKLSDVFEDDTLKDIEKPSISFSENSYDEIRPELEDSLQERCGVLDIIKGVYDWGILADILDGGEYQGKSYLFVAKVRDYEKHHKDLETIKNLIRKYSEEDYNTFFQKPGNDNYCAYVGSTLNNGQKNAVKRCTYDDFAKSLKKILNKITNEEEQEIIEKIKTELDLGTFLPLQVSKDNGVIPYQVHGMELKEILKKASCHYDFLNQKDKSGFSVSEKIIKLFEFRIPYYVGPLNTAHKENSWMVRREEGKILPWNFEQKVDEDASAEEFIRRMTNKCTYLLTKDVLPKNSLLYSEFVVWNELNNLKIKNEVVSPGLKQRIFDQLFKKNKRITGKKLLEFLLSEGLDVTLEDLTGFNQSFNSSLGSYLDFKKIFQEDIEKHSVQDMIEHLILWITLYGEETKMLKRVIRNHYDSTSISDEQVKKVCRLKYQGWGRFSEEFLTQIMGIDKETGEIFSIIQALRSTNNNLMQLLSQRFTFSEEIEKENEKVMNPQKCVSYDELVKDLVASLAIKRAIWQVVRITEEIRKIMGREPKKIFIEMARGPQEKKTTVSRQKQLIDLYKNIKDEEREWKKELEEHSESEFRSIKLYLYYTQMGRCMYSGEAIDLSRLTDATVYDRDHIYPQSKTKDDSLDNLVLVKREINANKNADVLSGDIQKKMGGFWRMLKEKKLISEEKYNRLTRKTALTDEELAGFINRQLVETRQSSKLVADLFKRMYDHSEVVYVKAKAVADFRHETLKMVKVRSMNDYHHAKDAYLNIVVGNVYHEKFTSNPLNWLRTSKERNYSLNQMFHFDITKKGKVIWEKGKDGTIQVVRKQLRQKDIQYTRYATENKSGQNGGFFDTQIVGKDDNASVPIKKGMDIKKYGGYKTITPAYFALVESVDKKGIKQRSIEAVPLYMKKEIEKNRAVFEKYCQEVYGLEKPKVLIPKIKKDSYFVINGFPMHLRGRTGNRLIFQGAVQLILKEEYEIYLKKVEKYIARNLSNKDKKSLLRITENEEISSEKNLDLYDELCNKQKDTIYQYRPTSQYENLVKGRETFAKLSCEEQCIVLNEILHLLQCKPITADLSLIGGSKHSGKILVSKVITKCESIKLVNPSVTGLFWQEIDLLAL